MFRELLSREFSPYGQLTTSELDQLESHFSLLQSWNRRLNLTRILTLEDAVRFHYCESLFLAGQLPEGPLRIADVGSGAGFPGIPLAIIRTDCEVTLIESHQRKAVFLREAARGLPNIRVVSQRAEDVSASFDWGVSRAVADPASALRLASHWALLLGQEGADQLPADWTRTSLPWGKNRVLAMRFT